MSTLQSDSCSDGTERDLVQQAPSARLALQPFQINSNSLQENKNKAKDRDSVYESVLVGCNDWDKALSWTFLNLKRFEDYCNGIRKRHGNGHSAPCTTHYCIKMFNILFKSLHFGMKIHNVNAHMVHIVN